MFKNFIDQGITTESLKFMKERHIDELFIGQRLHSKILFEHKLGEWQNQNVSMLHQNSSKYFYIFFILLYHFQFNLLQLFNRAYTT